MATNYQALLDMLKPQEEEPMMSQMTPEQTSSLQQAPEVPVEEISPIVTPQPAMRNVAAEQAPQAPEMPESPMSRSEALLAEYQRMMGKDQEELKAARERDRMLKVGGALGDSLATIINARSQMNVKAPGVKVQEGAGLGEIADMFARAPEIQGDVNARRQDLLKQYAEMARGERAQLDRDLRERQIAAYEAQTRAQARKANRDSEEKATKETQPSFEEKEKIKANVKEEVQVAKENRQLKEKLEPAIATVDDQIKNVKTALNLINRSKFAGTGPLDQYFAGATPEGQLLKKALRNIQLDTLVTKFQGMSRAVDTETDRKFFQETQPDMGNFETTNKKMLADILERLEGIKERSQSKLKEITSQKETEKPNIQTQQSKKATVGDFVTVKGKKYKVAEDGDTLIPVGQ